MQCTSIAPQQICYCNFLNNPIKFLHHNHLSIRSRPSNKRIAKTHFTTGIFYSLSAINSCNKEQDEKKNHQHHQNQEHNEGAFLNRVYDSSPIYLNDTRTRVIEHEIKEEIDRDRCGESKGIFTNMWWTNLKAALGQRINVEGLLFSVSVILRNRHWVMPHLSVRDIRYIDWAALKRKGFEGVVFDKDNTLTVPYSLALWGPLSASVESCKSVFGNNIAVFSNSAGLEEYDPDGRKARALEFVIGIRVIRHKVKKPAGSAEEIEKHFGCDSSKLIMVLKASGFSILREVRFIKMANCCCLFQVGDRPFTDIVYGNRNGFLTILTAPLSLAEEPFIVRQVRKLELALVNRWSKKGLTPANDMILPDVLDCVKDPPPL